MNHAAHYNFLFRQWSGFFRISEQCQMQAAYRWDKNDYKEEILCCLYQKSGRSHQAIILYFDPDNLSLEKAITPSAGVF